MKLLTTITAIALVMAATGCVSDNPAYEAARARNLEKQKQPFKPQFQPGLDMMGIAPSTVVFNDAPAPAPAAAPQPVVVVTPRSGTTMATQVGGTTVVSQFGGNNGLYLPPAPPIYTGSQTPTVYTMPIQQP
jgi:hypothetical protein